MVGVVESTRGLKRKADDTRTLSSAPKRIKVDRVAPEQPYPRLMDSSRLLTKTL